MVPFFGRGDKAAESGDVDYDYHHIIIGLYGCYEAFWTPNPKKHIDFWDYNPKNQHKFWD